MSLLLPHLASCVVQWDIWCRAEWTVKSIQNCARFCYKCCEFVGFICMCLACVFWLNGEFLKILFTRSLLSNLGKRQLFWNVSIHLLDLIPSFHKFYGERLTVSTGELLWHVLKFAFKYNFLQFGFDPSPLASFISTLNWTENANSLKY